MYKKSALCLWGFAQSFCRSVPALGLDRVECLGYW